MVRYLALCEHPQSHKAAVPEEKKNNDLLMALDLKIITCTNAH